jgi:hypothetical protein
MFVCKCIRLHLCCENDRQSTSCSINNFIDPCSCDIDSLEHLPSSLIVIVHIRWLAFWNLKREPDKDKHGIDSVRSSLVGNGYKHITNCDLHDPGLIFRRIIQTIHGL